MIKNICDLEPIFTITIGSIALSRQTSMYTVPSQWRRVPIAREERFIFKHLSYTIIICLNITSIVFSDSIRDIDTYIFTDTLSSVFFSIENEWFLID